LGSTGQNHRASNKNLGSVRISSGVSLRQPLQARLSISTNSMLATLGVVAMQNFSR
jgi:hypothetical protein